MQVPVVIEEKIPVFRLPLTSLQKQTDEKECMSASAPGVTPRVQPNETTNPLFEKRFYQTRMVNCCKANALHCPGLQNLERDQCPNCEPCVHSHADTQQT